MSTENETNDCPTLEQYLLPAITATVAKELADAEALVCTRVWEAWSYNTMGEDDFTEAVETEIPEELARAVLKTVFEKLREVKE